MICFRKYPIAIGITSGTPDYVAADICLKYLKEAIEIKCKKEEAEKKLNEKLENLKLPLPCGEEDQADGKMQAWMDKTILFTENPRNIQKVVFSQKGKMLNMRLVINDEEKTCDAGFKTWIRNDLYQDDYTKKHHCISYAFEKNRLNISVGLINTSYREEYCFCVDKDKLVCTWKPNVTYLPPQSDNIWKFTGILQEIAY